MPDGDLGSRLGGITVLYSGLFTSYWIQIWATRSESHGGHLKETLKEAVAFLEHYLLAVMIMTFSRVLMSPDFWEAIVWESLANVSSGSRYSLDSNYYWQTNF